jgi:ribonuclease VapC
MVIDTSALLAVLLNESDSHLYREAIESDPVRLVSAATVLETAIIVECRHGEAGGRELDLMLHKASCQTVSVDAEQVEIARDVYRRFGKGRHPAGLSYGDCFSYALARQSGEPLLFKGDDFTRTDVKAVLLGAQG